MWVFAFSHYCMLFHISGSLQEKKDFIFKIIFLKKRTFHSTVYTHNTLIYKLTWMTSFKCLYPVTSSCLQLIEVFIFKIETVFLKHSLRRSLVCFLSLMCLREISRWRQRSNTGTALQNGVPTATSVSSVSLFYTFSLVLWPTVLSQLHSDMSSLKCILIYFYWVFPTISSLC